MSEPTTIEKPKKDLAIDPLLAIGEQLRTQDNRATANPAFCVQVLERIGPIMLEYGSGEICFHDSGRCETYYHDGFDPEKWAELKKLEDHGKLPDEYTASSYVEKWITIQTCFTEAGCKRYLELDGHNLRHFHGVRIYAESFNRNVEMLEIRKHLLANVQTHTTMPAPQYIPYLKIKDGGYILGTRILSDFTLRITRKTKCSAPGKKLGFVTRYVKFIGRTSGESEEFELPVKAMASPVEFRSFCYSHGNYNAMINGRELCYLLQDLDADYERREIQNGNS